MPIKIPDEAKVLKLDPLTAIAAIKQMARLRLARLIDDAKAAMKRGKVIFAQSEFAVAHLRGGAAGGECVWRNPKKLFKLTQAAGGRRITLAEFLKCVRIDDDEVEKLLTPDEIEKISETYTAELSEGRLYVEVKPNMQVDFDLIQAAAARSIRGSAECQVKRAA